jgi:hypothetical protein
MSKVLVACEESQRVCVDETEETEDGGEDNGES